MKLAEETKNKWKDKVTLRQVLKTGKQIQDQMDQIGVASRHEFHCAVAYIVCVAALFVIFFGALAMRAIQ